MADILSAVLVLQALEPEPEVLDLLLVPHQERGRPQVLFGLQVPLRRIGDVHGPRREHQSPLALLQVPAPAGRDGADHRSLTVSPKRVLQQPRQLGVPVGHVA